MWANPPLVYRFLSSFGVLFMTVDFENGVHGDASADVNKHLELGKKLLAAGQLTEALSHYHAAVEGDPHNYLTYFKRAAVFLALGRSKSALPDLNEAIKLRPDFTKARMERGNIFLKQGDLHKAANDYETVLDQEPENGVAVNQVSLIDPIINEIAVAKHALKNHDYQAAIDSLSRAVETCPWDPQLRQMRADAYVAVGDLVKAIGDLRPTTKLISDNTDAHLKISQYHYELGEADESLKEVRECLKLDQDHKACHKHYKKVKKLVKFLGDAENYINSNNFDDGLFKLKAALKLESKKAIYIGRIKSRMCHCHLKNNKASEAIEMCSEVLQIEPENIDALCDRAEAHLLNEQYDEAVKDYQTAKGINGELKKIQDGLKKALKLQKQSNKRDYYKILGLKRSATKSQILKAYRKLAPKWHPDHYKGDDKKKAEKMFIDIAAAKEVLSDPEKRAKFDNGEDPLDPNAQNQNPWGDGGGGGGGFPFGEGFSFKFHF